MIHSFLSTNNKAANLCFCIYIYRYISVCISVLRSSFHEFLSALLPYVIITMYHFAKIPDLCSPYYGVLVRKEDDERMEHFQDLIKGLQSFSKELTKTSGPLFLANGQLSNVDLALVPWAYRYYVFEHYRGQDYVITPERYPELQPYFDWCDHVMEIDAVKRTLPDKDEYLEHIGKYADSSARSKVANAVRRGVSAHELDDEKDEY